MRFKVLCFTVRQNQPLSINCPKDAHLKRVSSFSKSCLPGGKTRSNSTFTGTENRIAARLEGPCGRRVAQCKSCMYEVVPKGVTIQIPLASGHHLASRMSSQMRPKVIVPPSISLQQSINPVKQSVASSTRRARSGSLVTVEHVGESAYDLLDQNAYANPNAEWVNRKGLFRLFPEHHWLTMSASQEHG
jgi:hypothetical protein